MPELTLVTFNLHGGMRPRRVSTPRPRVRLPADGTPSPNGAFDVVAVLGELDADVVVVQESWWPDDEPAAVDEVAAARGAVVYSVPFGRGIVEPWPHILHHHSPRTRGRLGMAVITRLPARVVDYLPVGNALADPARDRRAVHLELDVAGRPLDLIAVHLSSRLPYAPPRQLWRLRRQLPPAEREAVLVGDFNFWGPGVTALLPGWRRAVRGRTWPAHRPHSQIDHVLVRDGIDVVDAAVLDEVGSDHRPVRATLRIR